MPVTLKVKAEYNQAAKLFPQIARRLPTITRDAINKTATIAERGAVDAVAKALRIPIRFIRNRYDRGGRAKAKRVQIRRASTARLVADIEVYPRGIVVSQIAGQQIMRPGGGVKATGGRFYKSAFRQRSPVFKRQGSTRLPLMVPKIGVRERLTREFNTRTIGPQGIVTFRREYQTRIRAQLARYGVRA